MRARREMQIFAVRVRCRTTCSAGCARLDSAECGAIGPQTVPDTRWRNRSATRETNDVAQRAPRDRCDLHAPHARVDGAWSRRGRARSRLREPADDGSTRRRWRVMGGADAPPTCSDDCAAKGTSAASAAARRWPARLPRLSAEHRRLPLLHVAGRQRDRRRGRRDQLPGHQSSSRSANVALEVAQAEPRWSDWVPMGGRPIAPGASARLPISAREVTGAGFSAKAALRISSDRPVTVAEIESDDRRERGHQQRRDDDSPAAVAGDELPGVTYPQHATADVDGPHGSRGGAGRVMVVGTQRRDAR